MQTIERRVAYDITQGKSEGAVLLTARSSPPITLCPFASSFALTKTSLFHGFDGVFGHSPSLFSSIMLFRDVRSNKRRNKFSVERCAKRANGSGAREEASLTSSSESRLYPSENPHKEKMHPKQYYYC